MSVYSKATFLISAAKIKQLPEEGGIEVAFCGRSNAGKSTLLNCLTNQKSLAKTSKTPGRTQLINVFEFDEGKRLIDLPGYGFAKVPKKVKEEWQKTLNMYLETRECLKGIVILMDCRHPFKELDCKLIEWAHACGLEAQIVLTKCDKLKKNAKIKALREAKAAMEGSDFDVQLFSATSREGLTILTQKLDEWFR